MRIALSLTAALALAGGLYAEDLKSGPQVGSSKISAFNPLHVNGPDNGKKVCLV